MDNLCCELVEDADVVRALANVERAGEEVRVATSALEQAAGRLSIAEDELREAREHPRKFQVAVIYNGLQKNLAAERDELVKLLLARAIAAFGSPPQPHTLSLFTEQGVELDDNKTLDAAGVKPCEKLLLRPSKVKGGLS